MRAQIQAALISSACSANLKRMSGSQITRYASVPEHLLEPGDRLLGGQVLFLHALGELHRQPRAQTVHEGEGRGSAAARAG